LPRKEPTGKITDPCGSELKLDKQKDDLPLGFNLNIKLKVKQSRYRPGVVQRVPGS
jgi:hypothetical protein